MKRPDPGAQKTVFSTLNVSYESHSKFPPAVAECTWGQLDVNRAMEHNWAVKGNAGGPISNVAKDGIVLPMLDCAKKYR